MVTIAPYGGWTSPITADQAAAAGGGPRWVEQAAGFVWWAHARPDQGGRLALMRAADADRASAEELLGAPWNLRNRVHEYGGRPFAVLADPLAVVFTNWDDQRVYRFDIHDAEDAKNAEPVAISPAPERHHGFRYAEPVPGADGTEVWCVRETITGDAPTDVRRELVALPLDGRAADDPTAVRVVATSHRFLAGPALSPDGRRLAWIGWDHPAMPWDGTELCVADLSDGVAGPHRVLAGGPTEAVCQVAWDGPDHLLALTDPDNWWNLHRIELDGTATNLAPVQAEIGGALWQPGMRWFAPLGGGRHAVLAGDRLAVLDENSATVTEVDTDLTVWQPSLSASGGVLTSTASSGLRSSTVARLDLATGTLVELTPQPGHLPDAAYLPVPTSRVFTGPDGRDIPAHVYPPTNPDFAAPDGELPPYLVHVHGGPTGDVSPTLNLSIAYFTSRGLGVVVPAYGGSTGYGRTFRDRLREQWGVVDVEDCAAVARALAADGLADRDRLVVRGGSAGGWTTAASLTTDLPDAVDTYRCGTAMYPVLDLLGFAMGETHDFESQYMHGLVGPLPETQARYIERSPATHVDRIAGPILILQGLEDQVCPPVQADRFIAALGGRGIPHAYLTFEGEQHGFRRAETIRRALEAELSFYGQILGFDPPGVPVLALRT